MTQLLKAAPIIKKLEPKLKQEYNKLKINPKLVILYFSNNPASARYIKHKINVAKKFNITTEVVHEPEISYEKAKELIIKLNNDSRVQGILLQLPLAKHLINKTFKLLKIISPKKDVDVLNPYNVGNFILNKQNKILPPSVFVLYQLIKFYNIDLTNKNISVIGAGKLVGIPVFNALSKFNNLKSLQLINNKKSNLQELLKNSDIIIGATGTPKLLNKTNTPKKAIVIDYGTTVLNGSLVGDANKDLYNYVSAITPVPGGVGPLTIYGVINNLVRLV